MYFKNPYNKIIMIGLWPNQTHIVMISHCNASFPNPQLSNGRPLINITTL